MFVCECWLMLRHHCKGPDQGLKGNFDPVAISPLGRVSFLSVPSHLSIDQPTGAERLLDASPLCFLSGFQEWL